MTTLAVAWRIRRVAVYASIVPMLLMLAFDIPGSPLRYVLQFVVHRVVSDSGTYFNPDRVEKAVHGGIGLALGAMIGGALVEVLLSARPLRDSWPPLLPRPEVLRFGLAILPFAIAINLLPDRFLHYGYDVLLWFSPGDLMFASPSLPRVAVSVANDPHLDWSLTALIAAPLAGRMLSLPPRDDGARRGSAMRSIRLACTLVATGLLTSLFIVVAMMVLSAEIHAASVAETPYPMRLALLSLTRSAPYLIWYFSALSFISIAAAAFAITVRRQAASAQAVP